MLDCSLTNWVPLNARLYMAGGLHRDLIEVTRNTVKEYTADTLSKIRYQLLAL